jgi:hypothetical protein
VALPEKRYIPHAAVVFGGAIFCYFVAVLPARNDAAAGMTKLTQRHATITAALDPAGGGPVTKGHISAAEKARDAAKAEHDAVAKFFKVRDEQFEQYFADYTGTREQYRPTSFKSVYDVATKRLLAAAEPVIARDANGQKLNPFDFHEWAIAPSNSEIEPEQKGFWIQKAMVAVCRQAGAGVELVRVKVTTTPVDLAPEIATKLPEVGGPVQEQDPWTRWLWFPVEVEVELPVTQVGHFLAACGKPAEKNLLTEVHGFSVKSVAKVKELVKVEFDPESGEKPEDKVDIDAMEPKVRCTVRLAVLDPPTRRGGGE